ncbi:MAG: hypothetical protein DMF96_31825 [Acidobacteria bacterium]|nr:MAG: hypothetical protein DMF96_31825 [Acidobacteriota bacterium]
MRTSGASSRSTRRRWLAAGTRRRRVRCAANRSACSASAASAGRWRAPRSTSVNLDYLVSVVPTTAGTRHIVDAALLGALPPHAIFINPGRGSVVDEPALAAALTDGRLAGAVLDVFQQEPLPPGHVFWRTPNLLITSHTAALSAPEDIAPVFIENYRRLLRREPLLHQVDFELGY